MAKVVGQVRIETYVKGCRHCAALVEYDARDIYIMQEVGTNEEVRIVEIRCPNCGGTIQTSIPATQLAAVNPPFIG